MSSQKNASILSWIKRKLSLGKILYNIPWLRRFYVDKRYSILYKSSPIWDSTSPPVELVSLIEEGLLTPCRALDLGCGRGHTVRFLQSRGFDAWGLDISSLAVEQAVLISEGEGFTPQFIHGDAFSYSPGEKFSLLIDVGFYHIYSEDNRRYLAEHLYPRYLESGGTLLLWCLSEEEPDWGGAYRITRGELLDFFGNNWSIANVENSLFEKAGCKAYFMQAILK